MSESTPGPWTIDPTRNDSGHASINGKNWWELASVVVRLSGDVVDHPQGVANARLIASAPDLLMLAKEVEEYLSCIAIESDIPNPYDVTAFCDDMCGNKLCDVNGCIKYRIRMARAAISKATTP